MHWSRVGIAATLFAASMLLLPPASFAVAYADRSEVIAPVREPDLRRQESEYFYQQRAAPYAQVPERALTRALEESQERLGTGSLAAARQGALVPGPTTESAWVAIGPRPIGSGTDFGQYSGPSPNAGRAVSISADPVNPNIAYLGAAAGGVWKTTDGGTTWMPKADNLGSIAIGALTIDPNNPDVLYAGTGETSISGDSYYGLGIARSKDAGDTWALASPPVLNRQQVGRLAVDPNDSRNVYAAATNGVYRSSDAGITWTQVCLGFDCGAVTDVVIDATTKPSTVIAAKGHLSGGSDNGIYSSTTASSTWTRIGAGTFPANPDVGRIRLSMTRSTPTPTLYAAVAGTDYTLWGIFKSTDRGNSWTAAGTAGLDLGCGQQCWYNLEISAFPTDPNLVLVSMLDIFKSTNGGESWTNTTNVNASSAKIHTDQHGLAFMPGEPDGFYVVNDGGAYKSVDGGSTYLNLNQSLSLTAFYRGTTHPTNPASAIAGSLHNGTVSYDNSQDWYRSSGAGDGGYTAVDYVNPSNVYASHQNLSIMKSTDGPRGNYSSAVAGIESEPRQFIAPLVMSRTDPQVLYAGTTRLYRTSDGAELWTPISPQLASQTTAYNAISAIAEAPASTQTLYVGTGAGGSGSAKLWVTTDGGMTWVDRSFGLPNRTVTSIAVDQTRATVAYVTVSGFDSGHIWKTTNAGATWNNISGSLPNAPFNSVVVDNPHVYVGTDVGVYRSIDAGVTWAALNNGLPNVVVNDLVINRARTRIFAFTHGRGAYVADRTANVVGGRNFTISQGSVNLTWTPGNVGAGYQIVRSAMDSDATTTIPSTALPADATSYTDTDVLSESLYCYQLYPLDSTGNLLGTSDALCSRPNTRDGAAPTRFTLALNQSPTASMTWESPGDVDAYWLFASPLDGSPMRTIELPSTATSVTDDTEGAQTCYQLFAVTAGEFSGNTDMLCGLPGQATVSPNLSAANDATDMPPDQLPSLRPGAR